VKRGEAVPSYNLLSQTKHGHPILLNVSVILLPTTASPLATIHLFRDVTPQMQYEAYVELVLRAAMQLPPPQSTLGWEVLGNSPLLTPLTAREKAVVYFLVQGQTPRHIATTLGISYATVRNYLQNILHKFGVHSQRDVIKMALVRHVV
jgi:DNA-binding CsgD family transcriptional regulator